jgi:hypothetical protein
MSDDALSQLIAQQDREDEAKTDKGGETTWTRHAVDQAVGELAEDARVAVALRRTAGIFEQASMYYCAQLLRHAARALEAVSE